MKVPDRGNIIAAIQTVFDPEIPVNLYDLGLIYDIEIQPDAHVNVLMTLTTPNCPVAELLPQRVREAIAAVDGVSGVDVNLTWDPPWSGERMSEDARMMLDMQGISWKDPHGSLSQVTGLTVRRTSESSKRSGPRDKQ
ncbi:MAG: DUF59 domain-containing protein [Phycisphaerales bacterium]